MTNITKRMLTAASLILLAGISASCGDSATDSSSWNGRLFVALEPGVNLAAVPDTIILDPNDATAPRDPVTHKLIGKTTERGLTLVPLRMYFKRGRVKVAISLVKGKQVHDKRETIRKRETDRETRAAVKERVRA